MILIKPNAKAILSLKNIMFEAFTLRADTVEEQEESLRTLVRGLEESDRKFFFKRFSEQYKDPDTYAVLNFFFVGGLHHFYLKKHIRGFINLSLSLSGILFMFAAPFQDNNDSQAGAFGAGILILALITLIEIPNLFRSQTIAKDYNNRLSRKILHETSL